MAVLPMETTEATKTALSSLRGAMTISKGLTRRKGTNGAAMRFATIPIGRVAIDLRLSIGTISMLRRHGLALNVTRGAGKPAHA